MRRSQPTKSVSLQLSQTGGAVTWAWLNRFVWHYFQPHKSTFLSTSQYLWHQARSKLNLLHVCLCSYGTGVENSQKASHIEWILSMTAQIMHAVVYLVENVNFFCYYLFIFHVQLHCNQLRVLHKIQFLLRRSLTNLSRKLFYYGLKMCVWLNLVISDIGLYSVRRWDNTKFAVKKCQRRLRGYLEERLAHINHQSFQKYTRRFPYQMMKKKTNIIEDYCYLVAKLNNIVGGGRRRRWSRNQNSNIQTHFYLI